MPVRPPAPTSASLTRPRVVDFLLIFLGVMISGILGELSGLEVKTAANPSVWLAALAKLFPGFLFLPVGVILFWPVFFTTQKIFGRGQGLTLGEWLLGLAWLGSLALSGWIIWKGSGAAPPGLTNDSFKQLVVLAYVLFTLSMGAIAILLFLVGTILRWVNPWTHSLSLALLIWPAGPLALLWAFDLKLE